MCARRGGFVCLNYNGQKTEVDIDIYPVIVECGVNVSNNRKADAYSP